jgi:hypothetical protein
MPHNLHQIPSPQRSGTLDLDTALIFDTYDVRAEEVAQVLRSSGVPHVEIRTWEDIATERKVTRDELEARLAQGERILVAANYHALGSLQDVEAAIRGAGEGTRNWVVTCESVNRVRTRKASMGIQLPTIHLPWSSNADPRQFYERVQRCLLGCSLQVKTGIRRRPK